MFMLAHFLGGTNGVVMELIYVMIWGTHLPLKDTYSASIGTFLN